MTYSSNKNQNQTSISNSSTIPLVIGGEFIGVGELNQFAELMVNVETDKNGVLYCEFSVDGVNWSTSLSFQYKTDRINPPHIFEKGNRYFRVRFVNDSGEAQTYFRLLTTYGNFNKLTSPINGVVSENYDAIQVRPTNYKYEVAMGKRQGRFTVSNFGYNNDIDTVGEELIASFGTVNFNPLTDIIENAQTFTITYNNSNDGLGTTGATQLLIDYLDADFNLKQTIHVLANTGSDVTAFTGLGINRVVVLANGGIGYNVSDITFTATTDATIQSQIPATVSITQQCIYHVPINHTLLLDWLKVSALKIAGGGSAPRVKITGYSYSRGAKTRYKVVESEIDTSVENTLTFEPSQPLILSGRDVIYLVASTNVNNTSINARFSGILERNL